MAERVHVWETAYPEPGVGVVGKLVAVVHPEGSGDAHFEIHPDYRTDIEESMLLWAEEHLARPNSEGRLQLEIFPSAQRAGTCAHA